jgi:hypothetical protein
MIDQDDDSYDWRNGHTGRSKHGHYLDYVRQELPPRVRVAMEDAAGRVVQDALPVVWQQAMAQIQPIFQSLQRIWESNQSRHSTDPTTGHELVHGVSDAVPPCFDFNPLQDLDQVDFSQEDGFDFGQLDVSVAQYNPPLSESSYPTDTLGGTISSSATSNTSLEDQYLVQDPYKLADPLHDYTQLYPQGE